MKKRKVFSFARKYGMDFIYNILASLIYTIILQIIVYPFLSKMYTADVYGEFLTIIGVINTIGVSVGNTLNNVRLIQNEDYIKMNKKGDFFILLLFLTILSSILMFLLFRFYFFIELKEAILLLAFLILLTLRSYIIVDYRLTANYKMNFICNLSISAGYVLGLYFVKIYNLPWSLLFIIGEFVGIIFINYTSPILKEPLIVTTLFRSTSLKYLMMILSNSVSNALLYADRIILYPILGGIGVSIYNTSSLFGKTINILLGPIAGVILGYLSNDEIRIDKRKFIVINFFLIIFSICYYYFTITFSPIVTGIFYPTLIEDSLPFIKVVSLSLCINLIIIIIQPIILKYAPTIFQIYKELLFGLLYVLLGIYLSSKYGVYGFALASISAHLLKYLFIFFVGLKYIE